MIAFSDACHQVGYDQSAKAPEAKFVWFGYKSGQAQQFDSPEKANLFSSNVERVCINQNEISAFWDAQVELEQKASEIFHQALREKYANLPQSIYRLVYNAAYDRGHHAGYDEIANYMIELIEFAESIIEAHQKLVNG